MSGAVDKTWLDGLKPGDEVMTESQSRSRWSRLNEARTVVLRRTPKRIVVRYPWNDQSEWTVNAANGEIIGGSYRGSIRPITDADREREERAGLIRVIRRWADETLAGEAKDVSTAKLRAVAAVIDAA